MTQSDEKKIDQIQWLALAKQAGSFTYCLIDRIKQTVATAIAIKLGRQFFFATAGHVIEDKHKIEIIARDSVAVVTSSSFIARHCDGKLDIGLIELDPSVANRFDFTDRARLLTMLNMDSELPALVVGYPSQFIRSIETALTSKDRLRVCRCDALIFRSVVLPQSEWPDDGLQESLVAERDLLVDFKPEQRVRPLAPGKLLDNTTEVDCSQLDPHGISGSGIWLAQVKDQNGLWISDVRLIGIQTGWYEQNRWLRGVQIGAWLDMVKAKYPDLGI
jgi:hypothetical protein